MGKLIIGGIEYEDLGPKFINMREGRRWDATFEGCWDTSRCAGGSPTLVSTGGGNVTAWANGVAHKEDAKNKGLRRYGTRPMLRREKSPSLSAIQKSIRKFVLHHDGLATSADCWDVLHNQRGLSCHFLIDNDGTIYQTLDLALMGFHAAKYNVDSIGVEFCNRGDYKLDPQYYAKRGQPRKEALCKINGHTYKAWDFTPEQYVAMQELAAVLVHYLPELPLEYPTVPGSSAPTWDTLLPVDHLADSIPATDFRGYIAHYHLTKRKWDPGPFNFQTFIDKLRGQRCFPLWLPGQAKADQRPLVPSDPSPDVARKKIIEEAGRYTELHERQAGGGYFPVGPWGATRLWHGGIHVPADKGAPLYAPFPGRVVAARTGASSPIGSPNFVLLRHDLNIGRPVRFFTLYMHTADEPGGEGAPRWLAGKSKRVLDGEREVLGFDEAVEAGEVVGHAGEVGPDALYASQIHLEIFSREEVFRGDADWQKVDGAAGFRFCEAEEVNQLIDNDKDGRLSRVELDEYYAGGEVGDDMRRLVTYHVSEWTDEPAWAEELARSLPDFRKRSGKKKVQSHDADDEDLDIGALVSDQLDPFIWWTEPVAAALGLPRDGTVFHYHPMRFIEKVNLKLADRGSHDVREEDARLVDTTQVTDDSSGEGMFHEVEQKNPDDLHLTVEDLEAGWVGDRPAPGRGGPP
ncbi:MAG: N-acetylmuramoyl-L-alanine amidase [Kofleriaceae bacterium]|nr:N-acetylmuramoyl-L-alanine amidase [Kofleriaceae bacterium]MCL4228144.1 N-acetylmuramoyl-L-alanine amidase [Myxococcales bacterium]